MKAKFQPNGEFAPNLQDPRELGALKIGNLLAYYENLVKLIKAKSSEGPTYVKQLNAGMPFIFPMARCQSKREFASTDYDCAIPKSERQAIEARATRLTEEALVALREFDFWKAF